MSHIYAISIGVRPNNIDYVEDIMKGVEEAVNIYGGYIENVDTNIGYDDWIDVFIVGECHFLLVPRSAKPLNTVVLPRKIGLSFVGYMEYTRKRIPMLEEVKEFTCRPKTDARIADAINRCRECIEGSIDISYTFGESLYQLSEANSIGFYIFENPSNILHQLALDYSIKEKIDIHSVALSSNEEYIPILLIKPGYEEKAVEILRDTGLEPIVIGITLNQQSITWIGKPIPKITWDYVTGSISP